MARSEQKGMGRTLHTDPLKWWTIYVAKNSEARDAGVVARLRRARTLNEAFAEEEFYRAVTQIRPTEDLAGGEKARTLDNRDLEVLVFPILLIAEIDQDVPYNPGEHLGEELSGTGSGAVTIRQLLRLEPTNIEAAAELLRRLVRGRLGRKANVKEMFRLLYYWQNERVRREFAAGFFGAYTKDTKKKEVA